MSPLPLRPRTGGSGRPGPRLSLMVASVCLSLVAAAAFTGLYLFLTERTERLVVERLELHAADAAPDRPLDGAARIGAAEDSHTLVVDGQGTVLHGVGGTGHVPDLDPDLLRELAREGRVAASGDGTHRIAAVDLPGGGYLVAAWSPTWAERTAAWGVLALLTTHLVVAVVAALAERAERRLLRPLATLTRTVEAIAEEGLRERVSLEGAPHEIARLGRSFNTMLERLEQGFQRQRSAEERLRRFLADVGHELRTPLTALTGYLQLWRLGGLERDADRAEALHHMEAETRRLAVLVEEISLLARQEQKRPLERREVCLVEVCLAAAGSARVVDPDRRLRVEVSPGEHIVLGDPESLHQVVANLLANVRAHTPPGTEAVLNLSREGGYSVVDVVDDGPGIAPGLGGRVFERRVHGRGHGEEGWGLGLSIAAEAVRAHGGTIDAVPHEEGAWFRVRLPSSAGP
ncbi:sensor histidine kinase [Nocardiopsis aegyptia]|uniref:histidine kinase n=1 Tax=Nocardiopsis aegyptia TaxID=220378 RepID=A0A7Z0J7X4_9ACTN|nr:HAMP domain-containing sensor histidine kinase [Nocardiopsis aegyptia]NYJ32162.1 two-component system OmpR family sensor kinase [Nocardiopsis aegyptia]